MDATQNFGTVLARVRKEQGYATAHAFYKQQKGNRAFNITYRNYLNLESGTSLPKVERLEAILVALGFKGYETGAREIVDAYFKAAGLDRLARFWGAAPAAPPPESDAFQIGELAARRVFTQRVVNLTREQWKLRASNFDAHLIFVFLFNTSGGLTPAELSRETGIAPAAVAKAVKALVAAGLAKTAGGRVLSAFGDSYIQSPPKTPEMLDIWAALHGYFPRIAAASKPVHAAAYFARFTDADLPLIQRYMDQVTSMAVHHETSENRPDSAVYFSWCQLFRVSPR